MPIGELMTIPALSSAVKGMSFADKRFDVAAQKVAEDPTSVDDTVSATIAAPAAYGANAAMFRTADETRGSLLDVLA
jgi:hypothetical protein